MKKRIFISIVLALFVFPSAWAQTNVNFSKAQATIKSWFAAMKDRQIDKAAGYLAPKFTSIHTDGKVRNKAQEIELIKKLNMESYYLTDFRFVQSGDIIIATYQDKGSEKIDNQDVNPQSAGRMAILQKNKDKWIILAYANLDKIGSPLER